jgi:hypothetical protein
MTMGWQARWTLGATCVVVAAGVVLLARPQRRPVPPDVSVAPLERPGFVPSDESPAAAEAVTPIMGVVARSELSVHPDVRSATRKQRALAHARLRKARREARLRAKRSGMSSAMLLDADGSPVPSAVVAQGERFPIASPMEASELAHGLGGPTGNVSFWFQPQWSEGNQDDASFVEIADGRIRVLKNVDFLRFEFVDDQGVEHGLGASITDWKPGDWHQIAATWDGGAAQLYFDGVLVRETVVDAPLVLPEQPRMFVGSDFPEYRPVATGVVGGVQADARPLSPDEVRKRFAERSG